MKTIFFLAGMPGILLRESLRLAACRAAGLAVLRADLLRGGVRHDRPPERTPALLRIVPPAAGWSLASVLMLPLAAAWPLGGAGWPEFALAALGVAIAVPAAPSPRDGRGPALRFLHHAGPFLGVAVPAAAAWAAALAFSR
jgi:hypothetical protein